MEDKPTDFSKPIPGLPSLSTSREESIEIGSNTIENALTSEQISLAHKKHGKICWWWRKGRCHHGNKCWFEHNFGHTEPGRGSLRNKSITRQGWKASIYRSPRERERDKRSHMWRWEEVKELTTKALWKLGRELKMILPVKTKREALIKLIIADRSKTVTGS